MISAKPTPRESIILLVNKKTIVIVVRVANALQLIALAIVLECVSPLNFIVFLAIFASPIELGPGPIVTFGCGSIPHRRI